MRVLRWFAEHAISSFLAEVLYFAFLRYTCEPGMAKSVRLSEAAVAI